MKISGKCSALILALIILASLTVSGFVMNTKQGYHEDELLNYNLANSPQLLLEDDVKANLANGSMKTRKISTHFWRSATTIVLTTVWCITTR